MTQVVGSSPGRQRRSLPGGVLSRASRANWPLWIAVVGVMAVWQFIGQRLQSHLILVAPSEIVSKAVSLWNSGALQTDLRYSGIEFGLGFALGALSGIVLGILCGNWFHVGRTVSPFMSAVYAIPVIALSPLFIIGLGIGVVGHMAVVAFAAIFPTFLTTAAGVRATDATYRELGQAFRLSSFRSVTKIVVPSAIPYIVSGLRVAVGRSLTAVLAAELFGAQFGVGLLILNASQNFDTATVYVGIVIFAIAGVILTEAFTLIERRLAPWRTAA